MTVRLTQLDGKLPNLALMKLAHWHKSKGDTVVFKESIMRDFLEPQYDIVYGSAIFTSTQKKVRLFQQQWPGAIIGGTGVDENFKVEHVIGCGDYEYENYDYSIYPDFKHSIGFTQRGCRLRCSFCVVPRKEGKQTVVNSIADLYREGTERKIHLLDNDFFGQSAWKERATEIIDGGFKVCFNQGINVRLIHEEGASYLARMKYMDDQFTKKRIYTAWDNRRDENIFMKGINILLGSGIKPGHIMVYMLCGYWKTETWADIFHRLESMKQLGLMPYPMIYMDADGNDLEKRKLKRFQRWVVTRMYQWMPFEDYLKKQPPPAQRNLFTQTS